MPVTVPLLDLESQFRPLRTSILAAITRVCDTQQFILGPEVAALEEELATLLSVRYAIAVSSGTDALLAALMSLNIGPGDEVITSTYSFFATVGSIVRLGARPVLVDIDPATFNIDPVQAAAAITSKTRAIVPVHLFGLCADLDPLLLAAGRAGVAVIEDAAQAIGATYKSRQAGGVGTMGCFSFFPTKNLGAFGDAGLITTNDPDLAKRLRLLRTHGMEPRYHHHLVGGNFRMDALQAAVLRVKAPYLPVWTDLRRANAQRYASSFNEAGLAPWLSLPREPPERRHVFHQYVVRLTDRDGLKHHLDLRGIGNEIYYPVPCHGQPCFAQLGYRAAEFPHAEAAAKESLAIPISSELTVEQHQAVVAAVAEFFNPLRKEAQPAGARRALM